MSRRHHARGARVERHGAAVRFPADGAPRDLLSAPPSAKCSNTNPIDVRAPRLVRTATNGQAFRAGADGFEFWLLHVYGTPYEQGLAHGQLMAPEARAFVNATWTYLKDEIAPELNGLPQWLEDLIGASGRTGAARRARFRWRWAEWRMSDTSAHLTISILTHAPPTPQRSTPWKLRCVRRMRRRGVSSHGTPRIVCADAPNLPAPPLPATPFTRLHVPPPCYRSSTCSSTSRATSRRRSSTTRCAALRTARAWISRRSSASTCSASSRAATARSLARGAPRRPTATCSACARWIGTRTGR